MNIEREYYPEVNDNEDGPLYYIEFTQWTGRPWRWNLFQRQWICSKEEWEKTEHDMLESREVHPWNLGEGEVNERDVMDMNTRQFLKFIVDALNEKVKQKPPMKFDPSDFGETSGGF